MTNQFEQLDRERVNQVLEKEKYQDRIFLVHNIPKDKKLVEVSGETFSIVKEGDTVSFMKANSRISTPNHITTDYPYTLQEDEVYYLDRMSALKIISIGDGGVEVQRC